MRIGFGDEFIAIDEFDPDAYFQADSGSVNVSVQVKLKEFSGIYHSVSITQPEIQHFIGELERLEKTRQGEIVLSSFCPNEFFLTIRSRGQHKRLVVEVGLSRFQYIGSVEWNTGISGGFELDEGAIPSIVNSFKTLIQ